MIRTILVALSMAAIAGTAGADMTNDNIDEFCAEKWGGDDRRQRHCTEEQNRAADFMTSDFPEEDTISWDIKRRCIHKWKVGHVTGDVGMTDWVMVKQCFEMRLDAQLAPSH